MDGSAGSLRSSPAAGGDQPFLHDVSQLPRLDRLGKVVVHSRLQTFFPVSGYGISGEGNDRNMRVARSRPALPDAARRLIAIHLRHLAVHQDHVIVGLAERFEGLHAIGHQIDSVAEFIQHRHGHFLVGQVVLSHQDSRAVDSPGQPPELSASLGGETVTAPLLAQGEQGFTQTGSQIGLETCPANPSSRRRAHSLCAGQTRHQHQRRLLQLRISRNSPSQLLPVHAGQAHVQQCDSKRVGTLGRLAENRQGGVSIRGFFRAATPGAQESAYQRPVRGVIVHHQHLRVLQAGSARRSPARPVAVAFQRRP